MDPSWDTLQRTNISHLKKNTAVSCLVGSMTESKKNCVWNRSLICKWVDCKWFDFHVQYLQKKGQKKKRAWNPAIAYQSFAEKIRIHESSLWGFHLRIRFFNPWTGFSSNWTSIISPNNVSVAFTKKNPKEFKKKKKTHHFQSPPDHRKKKKGSKNKNIVDFHNVRRTTLDPSCQVTGLTCNVNF